MTRATKLKVRQAQRTVIGGDAADRVTGRSEPLRSQFLTGDQNLIHMRTVVQYSVGVPVDYLFQVDNVAALIGAVVEAELARSLARLGVDDILTTGKASLQEEVRGSAQKRMNDLRSGVVIASVNIETVTPPAEAADAFRDVASARADSSRIVNEAHGYSNDIVPRARGEARRMLETAEGHKQRVMNLALGDTGRFRQVAEEYAKASEVNGRRLYVETLEQVLPRIRKLFVDKNGNLDLTILRKDEQKWKTHLATFLLMAALGGLIVWKQGAFRRVAAAPSQPQDTIYETLDAVREDNLPKYRGAHTGAMEASLRRAAAEIGEARLLESLREKNATVKGVAIQEPERLSERESKARVEYVFDNRNEVQIVYLEKAGESMEDRGLRSRSGSRPSSPTVHHSTDHFDW